MNLENFPGLMSAPLLSVLDTADNQMSSKSFCGIELNDFFFFLVKQLVNDFSFLHSHKIPNKLKKICMPSTQLFHVYLQVVHLQKHPWEECIYLGSVFILGSREDCVK